MPCRRRRPPSSRAAVQSSPSCRPPRPNRFIRRERPGQRFGDPGRHGGVVRTAHTRHALSATGDQGLAAVRAEPYVVEAEFQLCLSKIDQTHSDRDLIECREFGKEFAVDLQREQFEVAAQLGEYIRGPLLEEHLPAAPLPPQVVGVINVANEVGLLEPDRVPEFEIACWSVAHAHIRPSVRTANTTGSGTSRTAVTSVAMCAAPTAKTIHGAVPAVVRVSGASAGSPALRRHSTAAQTRVPAVPASSPGSRQTRPARASCVPSSPLHSRSERAATASTSQLTVCSATTQKVTRAP